MKQKLGEFLFDISQTYPVSRGVNAEKVLEDARTYLIGKLFRKEIDYEKAKTLFFDNYDKRTFPEPKVLYEYLNQCEIRNYQTSSRDGELVVFRLPEGKVYSFTVSGIGKPLGFYKSDIERRFGKCKMETYPKGSVLIGTEVFES